MKKGGLSKEEQEYIRVQSSEGRPIAEIATTLERTPETIKKFIEKLVTAPEKTVKSKSIVRDELHRSPEWKQIEKQFTKNELNLFEEQYAALHAQFDNDVLASEETAIINSVTTNILMCRNLEKQKYLQEETMMAQDEKIKFIKACGGLAAMDETQRIVLAEIEAVRDKAEADLKSLSEDHARLGKEYREIGKTLKSRREDRIDRIKDKNFSFLDIIRKLAEKDERDKAGRQITHFNNVVDREYKRLGKEHKYMDGKIDRPILNSETVNWNKNHDLILDKDKRETEADVPQKEIDDEFQG